MKKTLEDRLIENIRTKVFQHIPFTQEEEKFIPKFLKQNGIKKKVFLGKKKFQIKKTWDIKLHTAYVFLKEVLEDETLRKNKQDLEQLKRIVLKEIFIIKSIIRKHKSENDFVALQEKVEKLVKLSKEKRNTKGRFIYKSNSLSIWISFKKKEISLKDYKTNVIYTKDISFLY